MFCRICILVVLVSAILCGYQPKPKPARKADLEFVNKILIRAVVLFALVPVGLIWIVTGGAKLKALLYTGSISTGISLAAIACCIPVWIIISISIMVGGTTGTVDQSNNAPSLVYLHGLLTALQESVSQMLASVAGSLMNIPILIIIAGILARMIETIAMLEREVGNGKNPILLYNTRNDMIMHDAGLGDLYHLSNVKFMMKGVFHYYCSKLDVSQDVCMH